MHLRGIHTERPGGNASVRFPPTGFLAGGILRISVIKKTPAANPREIARRTEGEQKGERESERNPVRGFSEHRVAAGCLRKRKEVVTGRRTRHRKRLGQLPVACQPQRLRHTYTVC
ncbi:hypothetical protein MRX96_041021 [Rhipicephalus microplus]